MPLINLTRNEQLSCASCLATASMAQTSSKLLSYKAINSTDSVLPRNFHQLHRRDTSPGIVGIVIGLTILATIIVAVMFIWNWKHFKQSKARQDERQQREQHQVHTQPHTHTRPHQHRHSRRHHHTVTHLNTDLEENQEGLDSEQEQENQHQHFRHHPNCRHQRLYHSRDSPSWGPRRPEPVLHRWTSHRGGIPMPNEMDAPQIYGDGGWEKPGLSGQRERAACV